MQMSYQDSPTPQRISNLKPLDIDVWKYDVVVINSFEFDPENFPSFDFEEDKNENELKPYIKVQILVQSKLQMRKLMEWDIAFK